MVRGEANGLIIQALIDLGDYVIASNATYGNNEAITAHNTNTVGFQLMIKDLYEKLKLY